MKKIFMILMILLIIGCSATVVNAPTENLTDVECNNAPVICWGERGVNPVDIEGCYKVFACSDWELNAR